MVLEGIPGYNGYKLAELVEAVCRIPDKTGRGVEMECVFRRQRAQCLSCLAVFHGSQGAFLIICKNSHVCPERFFAGKIAEIRMHFAAGTVL